MPLLGPHTLPEYRIQTREELMRMFEAVLAEKDTRLNAGDPWSVKLYQYLEPLHAVLAKESPPLPVGIIEQSIVRYLDGELLDMYIADELDGELKEVLSVQVMLLAAATAHVTGITPYTYEEFTTVLSGAETPYHDNIFVYTLHHIITENDTEEYAPAIVKILPSKQTREDNYQTYFWDDALVLSMIMHAAWRFFPIYPSVSQQFLLQHYLYDAITVGVPVRYWMSQAIRRVAEGGGRTLSNFFLQSLAGSREEIYLDPIAGLGRPIPEVMREFSRLFTGDQLPAMVQEKYISTFYTDAELKEELGPWLREFLAITSHLKNGVVTF